jgi:hypothetical protein
LYDLSADPDELCNLAGDSQHTETCGDLRQRLFADGWDPEKVRSRTRAHAADYKYLYRYARAVEPTDPLQWGLPAQL